MLAAKPVARLRKRGAGYAFRLASFLSIPTRPRFLKSFVIVLVFSNFGLIAFLALTVCFLKIAVSPRMFV